MAATVAPVSTTAPTPVHLFALPVVCELPPRPVVVTTGW